MGVKVTTLEHVTPGNIYYIYYTSMILYIIYNNVKIQHKCMIHNYIIGILTKITAKTVVEKMDPAAPRPQDPSVLTMQQKHWSTPLWDAQVSCTIVVICILLMITYK